MATKRTVAVAPPPAAALVMPRPSPATRASSAALAASAALTAASAATRVLSSSSISSRLVSSSVITSRCADGTEGATAWLKKSAAGGSTRHEPCCRWKERDHTAHSAHRKRSCDQAEPLAAACFEMRRPCSASAQRRRLLARLRACDACK